jgi:hypothetical protein
LYQYAVQCLRYLIALHRRSIPLRKEAACQSHAGGEIRLGDRNLYDLEPVPTDGKHAYSIRRDHVFQQHFSHPERGADLGHGRAMRSEYGGPCRLLDRHASQQSLVRRPALLKPPRELIRHHRRIGATLVRRCVFRLTEPIDQRLDPPEQLAGLRNSAGR